MKVFYLRHRAAREAVGAYAMSAEEGLRVTFAPATRKTEQNDKFHAQIDDIAKQSTYAGKSWQSEDMKRILIDEFAEEMRLHGTPLHNDGAARLVPSENGRRVIQLGIQSRDFYVSEARDFITFLDAWGDDRDVVWTEPKAVTA